MRIIIDIPEEFESDYKGDMFKDFFSRVLCDIQDGTLCGNYEKEIAEMLLKAFDESIPMDKIVEELEKEKTICFLTDANTGNEVSDLVYRRVYSALDKAIEIAKGGGKV